MGSRTSSECPFKIFLENVAAEEDAKLGDFEHMVSC
jgi:hypothetical protein